MSDTFDRFMRQYRAQGREKADGYAKGHFSGLTDEEKARVFELLSQEAERDPRTATHWLFHLDPSRAAAITQAQIQRTSGDPGSENYVRQLELLKHTGDLEYQDAMIDEYPQNSAYHRGLAVEHIVRTPLNDRVHEFLRNLVLNETDFSPEATAAVYLLRMHKVQRGAAEYEDWSTRLKSPSLATRFDALQEMEAKYPYTP